LASNIYSIVTAVFSLLLKYMHQNLSVIFCCVCNVLVCFVAGEVFVDVVVVFYSPDQLAIYIALTTFLSNKFSCYTSYICI
jgi:hypothetical protein